MFITVKEHLLDPRLYKHSIFQNFNLLSHFVSTVKKFHNLMFDLCLEIKRKGIFKRDMIKFIQNPNF